MALKVFLVEDMKQLQGVILDLLKSVGSFSLVATATTEAEATLWFSENQDAWDLAIVDLVLEQGTGMGVIGRCKRRSPAQKLIVLSDYITPGIERHCLKLGADVVFSKAATRAFVDYVAALPVPPAD